MNVSLPIILLTGASGNIGQEVIQRLHGCRIRALVRDAASLSVGLHNVEVIMAPLHGIPKDLANDTEVIIHCAANTGFRTPIEELRTVNVEGTRQLLEFARRCPRLRKFVHISTACISGDTSGLIPEEPLERPSAFLNPYEQSKWEAEALVLQSDLPIQIVRLSIVAGSEVDGFVRRQGALHHALFWLWRGLIPMVPGTDDTRIDLISTEHAASAIAAAALSPSDDSLRILNACAGEDAAPFGELLDHLKREFSIQSAAWRSRAILPPTIVDAETYRLFESTIQQSGDVLFQRVAEDAKSFLPSLLHPRLYATGKADRIHPRPSHHWRSLASLVSRYVIHQHTHSGGLSIRPAASHQRGAARPSPGTHAMAASPHRDAAL